ncbi:TIGR02281 family clan AA aspartic protease [uncultured Paracoccus sp.]|uniref:retropepsin-like aspartic protease family protein n=1 Tax=uncultured Paracoccus sp. TaxID=189685 RepID=UPI00261EACF4|nr:TIGR02281 family clan AA aspartic protease [uncultured Paracoccus sp.]
MIGDDFGRLAYLVLLLVAIGSFLIVDFRHRPGQTTRHALAWGLIFIAVVAAAGLWGDVRDRIAPRQQMLGTGRIEVPVSRDGHFHLTAHLNDVPVRFVVDTGASAVALRQKDAERVGIALDDLAFAGVAQTANGVVETASVVIDRFSIGDISDERVPAIVLRGELDRSLLGMSYLRRFARVGFEGDRMILER